MPFTLLAILLAFAAPMPLAELPTAPEDEAIVESCRGGRAVRHRVAPPSLPPAPVPAPSPSRPETPDISASAPADWTPRLFSPRPPPL
jgi:hypothetical protein